MTAEEAVKVLRLALEGLLGAITEDRGIPISGFRAALADARAALRDTAPESVGVCASDTQPHRGEHPKRGGCRNWREVKP